MVQEVKQNTQTRLSFYDGQLALPCFSQEDLALIEHETGAKNCELPAIRIVANEKPASAGQVELISLVCHYASLLTISGKMRESGQDLLYVRSMDGYRICYRDRRGCAEDQIQIFAENSVDCIFEADGPLFLLDRTRQPAAGEEGEIFVVHSVDLQDLMRELGELYFSSL